MRKFVLLALLFSATLSSAQTAQFLKKGTTEIGFWGGGGTGLSASSDWRFINAGVRFGRVLTNEVGSGVLRGNFEFTGDIIPLWVVRQPENRLVDPVPLGLPADEYLVAPTGKRQTAYGGGFAPVILKWNFTRGKRIAPYIAAEGGVMFTNHDVPLPNSSNVNFTPGGAFGIQWFRDPKHAIVFSGHVTHISNASMGEHNPGINATILFRIGYSWFK